MCLWTGCLFLEANPTAATGTDGARVYQFDTRVFQGGDELHERIDVSTNDTITPLHALYRGHGKSGDIRELSLIDSEEGASGTQLGSSDHASYRGAQIGRIGIEKTVSVQPRYSMSKNSLLSVDASGRCESQQLVSSYY
jgi:hypothetical protein